MEQSKDLKDLINVLPKITMNKKEFYNKINEQDKRLLTIRGLMKIKKLKKTIVSP